jgi:hypothetical protein
MFWALLIDLHPLHYRHEDTFTRKATYLQMSALVLILQSYQPDSACLRTLAHKYLNSQESQREREKIGGVVVRDTIILSIFKVPRHCPLVLLIRVRLEFRDN